MPEVKIITATYLHTKYKIRSHDDRDWYSRGKRSSNDGSLIIVCEACRSNGRVHRCFDLGGLLKELERK